MFNEPRQMFFTDAVRFSQTGRFDKGFNVTSGGVITLETGAALVAPNPSGAQDYYVDLNRVTSGDGKTWNTAMNLIAEAIAASNASIGLAANRWWARRNRIFVCGDEIHEHILTMPEKCDIIGVGTDLRPFPRVFGKHTLAVAKVGTRFINMGFNSTTTGVMMTVPAGSHGFGLEGCHFEASAAGVTKGLMTTDSAHMRLNGNTFTVGAGSMTNILGLAMSIEGLVAHDIFIGHNKITATLGISIVEAAAAAMGGMIHDNYLRTTGIAIDDNSDDFAVVNNRWMTDVDTTTSTAGYDFNIALAAGNIQMGITGLCDAVPFMKIAE